MVYRIQASILYPKNSGLATWSRDQMAVRYEQAIHLKEGESNEEEPINKIVDKGDNERFICDLPLLDESHAQDAFNTLTAESVWTQAIESGDEMEVGSYINLHRCGHDETPQQPCENIEVKKK